MIDDRGFHGHETVDIDYGGKVRIKESSAAQGPCIWLFYNGPVKVDPASHAADWCPHETLRPHEVGHAGLHMTLAQAERVHAQLGSMIERMRASERDWIGELNAAPEPEPLGPGMWISTGVGVRFWQQTVGALAIAWYDSGDPDGQRWYPLGLEPPGTWRRATPDEVPDNAADLYELLGYERCEYCDGSGETWSQIEGHAVSNFCLDCGSVGFVLPGR